jgi:hypothetical protein
MLSGCTFQKSAHNSIYIDAKYGDDAEAGTFRRPIKTISELNRRLEEKPANVYFSGNQDFEGSLVLNNLHGSEDNPIRISSPGRKRTLV